MLRQYNEKQFELLKGISQDRLSPETISTFFLGAFIFSFIMTLIPFMIISQSFEPSTFKFLCQFTMIAVIGIQLIITIIFLNTKISYKFQKIQSYLLTIIALKLSLDTYLFYFGICIDKQSPAYMYVIGFLAILAGFLLLFISIIRAINRVKKGEFKKKGKGIFDFKDSKGYVSLPIIFAFSMFGGLLGKSMNGEFGVFELFIPLLLAMVIQYAITMAIPEFMLLNYCKTRFKSFNSPLPMIYQ